MVHEPRRSVLELSHSFIDQRNQISQPVAYRRIDGDARVFRLSSQGSLLRIRVLGERDQLRQNIDLLIDAAAVPEQDIQQFFEAEEPKRQSQIALAQDLGLVAEAVTVFPMRI